MRKVLAGLAIVGSVAGVFATESRVITLGRSDNFFMDDQSIFKNPANVNVYPNMLLGSGGEYVQKDDTVPTGSSSGVNYAALNRTNRDPQRPYAGGIISYSFNQSSEAGNQFPMLSFGLCLNRNDTDLDYLIKGTELSHEAFGDSIGSLPSPIGKVDAMLGYALPNGGMLGIGTYMAFQNEGPEQTASIYKYNLGVNWPIAKSIDGEASVSFSAINAIGLSTDTLAGPKTFASFSDNQDFILGVDARMFSALTVVNGDLVPHASLKITNLGDYAATDIAAGIGINLNVDKGFGWGGAEVLYSQIDVASTVTDKFGVRIGFGFERNIMWDWFVFRAGGSKTILHVANGDNSSFWEQNPEADASDKDFLGIGIGFNVENRLKIDCVVAEDVVYTFTNLISGPQHHLINRFNATYSF